MKKCSRCKIRKGTIHYSTNSYGSKYYHCLECNAERARKYRTTQNGKEVYREIMARQRKTHPNQVNARTILNQAVLSNKVKKPLRCSVCNKKKVLDGHHEDYNKPLEVIWMCRQCHREYHRNILKSNVKL